MASSSDKLEKIIHSLLCSPCNFTPLLHFVLPVQYEGLQSFAEIWINPNGGEDDRERQSDGGRVIHMLLAFDVGGIGRFELELFVRDKVIDFFPLLSPGLHQPLRRGEKTTCASAPGTPATASGRSRWIAWIAPVP